MVAHYCNLSAQKVEAVGLGVQDHPQLQGEFEVSLGYMRFYLNKMNRHKKNSRTPKMEKTAEGEAERLWGLALVFQSGPGQTRILGWLLYEFYMTGILRGSQSSKCLSLLIFKIFYNVQV